MAIKRGGDKGGQNEVISEGGDDEEGQDDVMSDDEGRQGITR